MSRIQRSDQTRPQRVPLAEQRNKLTVSGLDANNFYYRWVNDRDDRLQRFLNAGYVFVEKSEIEGVGDPTVESSKGTDSRVVKSVGGPLKAYLMKIEKTLHADDQKMKQREIDETERAMRTLGKRHSANQQADYGKIKIGSVIGDEK